MSYTVTWFKSYHVEERKLAFNNSFFEIQYDGGDCTEFSASRLDEIEKVGEVVGVDLISAVYEDSVLSVNYTMNLPDQDEVVEACDRAINTLGLNASVCDDLQWIRKLAGRGYHIVYTMF